MDTEKRAELKTLDGLYRSSIGNEDDYVVHILGASYYLLGLISFAKRETRKKSENFVKCLDLL